MAIRRLGWGLLAGAAAMACNGGGGAAPSKGAGGAGDAGMGQSSSGGAMGTGTGLLSVTLENTGRHGDDVLFTVSGSDPTGRTTEAHVSLLDVSGAPVIGFDTDWDAVPDSAEQRLHFDQSTLGQKTFKQTITLPRLYKTAPSIASALVQLSDASGTLSAPVTASLAVQPVRNQGDGCDPATMTDRCAEGLSCSGTPSVCVAGVAPALTRVAYFGGDNPSELFLGSDPDEDMTSIQVSFLDATGKPVVVDLSGDSTPASSVTLHTTGLLGQTFFFENDPVPAFATTVPKIGATVTDAAGRMSPSVTASISTQSTVANGLSCDPYGFTVCAKGSACSPGVPGVTNKCSSIAPLQSTKCGAAPGTSTDGTLAAWGVVNGVSLWDPPAGCGPITAIGRPESVVTLKLAQTAGTLTISTAMPETDFDTILYVLPTCASSTTEALGCSDDAQGFASTVTLMNVPPGTYAIVVDSVQAAGGHFGLSVTAQ